MTRAVSALLGCLALLAQAAPALAADPAERFNAPGQTHANVCARLASPTAPLRFASAGPTGFALSDSLEFTDRGCATGSVRLDLHETIPSSGGALAFHRGGNGYVDGANVKYGHLRVGDLVDDPGAPVPSSGGRGAACRLAGGPAYSVRVRSIPAAMHYKRPQDVPSGSNNGTSFEHYGDPAADQGDRTDIHYSYLLWSFVNVRGGGMVRALLAPGDVVRVCDVEPVTMQAWDSEGNVNGTVTARYVRLLAGSCPLYGWMVWSREYYPGGGGPVAHALPVDATPGPDPAPAAGCPDPAHAAPPEVVTGDVSPDGTLTGSVDPNGVPTSWWFEYAGTASAPVAMNGTPDVARPVSVASGTLPPGSRYRLVAESTHGRSFGEERTLPAPPPPEEAPSPSEARLPAEVAPSLSRVRVTPGRFRRARRRSGAPARIRFTLAGRATTVALTLERKTRRGRWTRVNGSIVRRKPVGRAAVRFGGWLGGRNLPAGRYRVRAAADGASTARRAGFTLR